MDSNTENKIYEFKSNFKLAEFCWISLLERAKSDTAATLLDWNIGISGGSMPSLLLEYLKHLERDSIASATSTSGNGANQSSIHGQPTSLENIKAATASWHWWWIDERCVALDHKDSNYAAWREVFGILEIDSARIHHIKEDLVDDPVAAAKDYSALLRTRLPLNKFHLDVSLLGMGPDGHTASLFPNHPLLVDSSPDPCLAILDSPKPPSCRITLSLPFLQATPLSLVISTGASKSKVLHDIHVCKTEYPVSKVKTDSNSMIWLLDGAAAELLPKSLVAQL